MSEPIKVQAFDKFPYKFIEWKLHDKCNYNCSFCGDENKLGIVGWADLQTNKAMVDDIAKACEGYPYWIQLTGGEPTLYPRLIELLSYMKEKGAMVKIISNGSRTIRWWKLLRDAGVVDYLMFTYHSEQKADYRHLTEVANLFHDEPTVTVNLVTYVASSIDLAIEGAEYLIEHTGSYVSMNAMDFVDERIEENRLDDDRFEKVKKYSLAFGKLLDTKKQSPISMELMQPANATITYNDGTQIEKDVTLMMKLGENKFEGWVCEAGIDSINIEGTTKFRGGCKRGATSFKGEGFKFFDKPFICDTADCFCATDMITTKRRDSD